MPDAKSRRGEGDERASVTVLSSPAMRKLEASRVKRKFCVVHGVGVCKSSPQQVKPSGGVATSGGGSEPAVLWVKRQGVVAL